MFHRILSKEHIDQESCFMWGPRQSGKSTLLRELFPQAPYYDLLLAKEHRRLAAHPGLLAEECAALGWSRKNQPHPIIIDEVQKLPELLDEVHSLISRHGLRFILTGCALSSRAPAIESCCVVVATSSEVGRCGMRCSPSSAPRCQTSISIAL